ncbi:MAG: hypothetical protein ACJAW7_002421 [Candidatus Azotimanducaceae bacterium]|jgi:hypothetical protein
MIFAEMEYAKEYAKLHSESYGVRVKGQSKDCMEVSPHNIQFKSFANGLAILLQVMGSE